MAHRHRHPNAKRQPRNTSPLHALFTAFQRASLLTPHERMQLLAPVRAAFDAFRAGQGNEDALIQLVDTSYIALELAARRIAGDHTHTMEAAQAVLVAVQARHTLTGSWTLRGPEIAALDALLWLHEVQLNHCSHGEFNDSVQTVIRRVRQAVTGNAGPNVIVIDPKAQALQAQQAREAAALLP